MAVTTSDTTTMVENHHSLVNTTFPVLLPEMPELRLAKAEFDAHINALLPSKDVRTSIPVRTKDETGSTTQVDDSKPDHTKEESGDSAQPTQKEKPAPFMDALLSDRAAVPSFDSRDGKMLTENADVAYKTSGEALVDLFFELEDVISASRLEAVLQNAWQHDAEATLRIIWNARSIHLGKSSRVTFYRAVGWLAQHHPRTLIENLPWLVRPLVQKKASKQDEKTEGEDAEMVDAKDTDSDFELIEGDDTKEELEDQPKTKKLKLDDKLAEFDIKYGVSHGYWKDLLNILALAANDELKVDGKPKNVLNVEKPKGEKCERDWTKGRKKTTNVERHDRAVEKLETGRFYKALYLCVARLFADQLKLDLARLISGQKAELKRISLAAKWAPTHKCMHDQHTSIVSSIAELLHPFDSCCPTGVDPADRELYLKYARVAYQSQILSPLRKHLQVVERDITAGSFQQIKYERVPSLAMQRYTPLFAKKDFEHFDTYIEKVAAGKKQISGATLLPSTLVASEMISAFRPKPQRSHSAGAMVNHKLHEIQMKSIDGQWKSLVQRIKDSGTLESSIAVCDVSGSMLGPVFADKTQPIHSSIGLSLLLSEVTKPPFGGAMITFHSTPQVLRVGGPEDKRSLHKKVRYIERSEWGANTDFVAVFEKLILPMAVENKLAPEDMVKQVFVFSDMQFDSATGGGSDRWTSSYERIQKKFKEAGYEMPRLIFWNLADGRAGYEQTTLSGSNTRDGISSLLGSRRSSWPYHSEDAEAAPKPVTAAEQGTALVSGYSQGQLKMFLDGGGFEGPEEDEVVEEKEGDDGEVVVGKEKKKQDPLDVVKKAISHEAYRMLKVVD